MTGKDPLLTPPEGMPRHTDEVDKRLAQNLRQVYQLRWILVGSVITLLVGAVVTLTILVFSQQQEVNASCQLWRSLIGLPVTVNPQTGQPTRLSVSIIAGARAAYVGERCGGLLPPDPSVAKWARIYNINLP